MYALCLLTDTEQEEIYVNNNHNLIEYFSLHILTKQPNSQPWSKNE
jgi:hypothetical protein